MLLLILHADKANPGCVPGKLYEYMAARRPIMAIIPAEFEAARLIRETSAGVTVDVADPAGIDRCLIDSYAAYKSNAAESRGACDLSPYERRRGAQRLAQIFTECTGAQERQSRREV
jgi:hypothetical protein